MVNFSKNGFQPRVGKFFRQVIDHEVGDIYYNCEFISVEDLYYYDHLLRELEDDGDDISVIAIGLRYEAYEERSGYKYNAMDVINDKHEETHFTYEELPFLSCHE